MGDKLGTNVDDAVINGPFAILPFKVSGKTDDSEVMRTVLERLKEFERVYGKRITSWSLNYRGSGHQVESISIMLNRGGEEKI